MRLHQLNFICNRIEQEYSVLGDFPNKGETGQKANEEKELANDVLEIETRSDSEDSVFSSDVMSEDFNAAPQSKKQNTVKLLSLQEIMTLKGQNLWIFLIKIIKPAFLDILSAR